MILGARRSHDHGGWIYDLSSGHTRFSSKLRINGRGDVHDGTIDMLLILGEVRAAEEPVTKDRQGAPLDEVVVDARRRDEPLSNQSIAVAAISNGEEVGAEGRTSMRSPR